MSFMNSNISFRNNKRVGDIAKFNPKSKKDKKIEKSLREPM